MPNAVPKPDILIVDDSEMFCYLASLACRKAGIENVYTAQTVDEACDLIDAAAPQACLLDARIGTKLSVEVAQRLSKRSIPFTLCSGGTAPREFAPYLGDAGFLAKPSSFEDLTAGLQSLVGRTVSNAA